MGSTQTNASLLCGVKAGRLVVHSCASLDICRRRGAQQYQPEWRPVSAVGGAISANAEAKSMLGLEPCVVHAAPPQPTISCVRAADVILLCTFLVANVRSMTKKNLVRKF